MQAAADALGIARSAVMDAVTKKRSAKTVTGYIVIRKSEYDKDKDYSIKLKKGTSPYLNIPNEKMVLVFRDDILVNVFPNCKFASNDLGLSKSCISKRCREDFFKTIQYFTNSFKNREKFMYLKDTSEEIKKQALALFREKYDNLDKKHND